MAMLKPHFQLTPLIGASNLVGVSSDEDNEHLVVTLGSNMVSVFHVSSFICLSILFLSIATTCYFSIECF